MNIMQQAISLLSTRIIHVLSQLLHVLYLRCAMISLKIFHDNIFIIFEMRIFNSKCKSVLRERSTRNSFLLIRFKILLADLYVDKNYYIDIFHFDDYLNKQLMGSSENQFLMLYAKLMVIFLFLLKGSFAVLVTVAVSYSRRMNSADLTSFTRPDLSDNFLSNKELTSCEVNLRAIIELEILFRKRNYRLEYGRTLNTN